MPQALNTNLIWRPLRYLLTSAALHLLTQCSYSLSLVPTLAPPLSMVINGERKTLVVCMANDPSEDALGAIWFSNGNGTMLKSFTYGISREEDGTFSTLSQLSVSTQEFESWDMVACYVAQNNTSRMWSTTSLPMSEENMRDPCLDETQGAQDQTLSAEVLRTRLQILLLLAIRMLLFKCILFDVLMTCCLLYKRVWCSSPFQSRRASVVRRHLRGHVSGMTPCRSAKHAAGTQSAVYLPASVNTHHHI